MAQPSSENFLDILIKELSFEIREEIRAELRAEAPTSPRFEQSSQKAQKFVPETEAGLLLELGPKIFMAPKRAYHSQTKQKTKANESKARPVKPKMARHLTSEQYIQFKILIGLGANLTESFSETELKKEFRKLAHHFHPDHQIQADEARLQSAKENFRTLKNCYDCLKSSLA